MVFWAAACFSTLDFVFEHRGILFLHMLLSLGKNLATSGHRIITFVLCVACHAMCLTKVTDMRASWVKLTVHIASRDPCFASRDQWLRMRIRSMREALIHDALLNDIKNERGENAAELTTSRLFARSVRYQRFTTMPVHEKKNDSMSFRRGSNKGRWFRSHWLVKPKNLKWLPHQRSNATEASILKDFHCVIKYLRAEPAKSTRVLCF